MLRVECLTDPAELDALTPEWDMLHADLSPCTPFTSARWNRLWWSHFHEDRFSIRDELRAYTVRDTAGRLLAIAPMMLTRRPSLGPIQARVLQFFGSDPNVTEIRGPACRPQDQAAVMQALSRHLSKHDGEQDWLHWSGIRADALPEEPHFDVPHPPVPNYYLPLPNSWDEFRSRLSRNIKESLRKCYNSLKRDGHVFEFVVIDQLDATPAALEQLFRLHASRARSGSSVKHADVFRTRQARRFITDYATQLARRGELRIFQLRIAGKVVATRMGFLFGRELYLYYSGFDPDWAAYSVMTTTVAETIRWAIDRQLDLVNLSSGNDVSKTRWGPQEVLYHGGVQIARHPHSDLTFQAYQRLQSLKRSNSVTGNILMHITRGR